MMNEGKQRPSYTGINGSKQSNHGFICDNINSEDRERDI